MTIENSSKTTKKKGAAPDACVSGAALFCLSCAARVGIRSWVTDLCHRLVSLVVVKAMVEDTKPWHKFCTGYRCPIARSHMCFQKPLMMWLFETHVASQHLPLRRLGLFSSYLQIQALQIPRFPYLKRIHPELIILHLQGSPHHFQTPQDDMIRTFSNSHTYTY